MASGYGSQWWSDGGAVDHGDYGAWQGSPDEVPDVPRRTRRRSTSSCSLARSSTSQEEREMAWRPPDYPFFRRSDPRYIDYLHEMQANPATKRCFDARLHKACRSHTPSPRRRGRSPHRCESCQPNPGKAPHTVRFTAAPPPPGSDPPAGAGAAPAVRPTAVEEDRCTIS
eukprot:EG_transcript_16871